MGDLTKTVMTRILDNEDPSYFVYSPNYWQWHKHHKDHDLLPEEIRHCDSLTALYNYLGVDIFSRNIYSDPEKYWFGGLCEEIIDDFEIKEKKYLSGKDKVTEREYYNSDGVLRETLVYMYNESTLVQRKFLIDDYVKDFKVFRNFVAGRKWQFNKEKYDKICRSSGEKSIVIAGEFFSPLKMLHLALGAVNTVYFLMEYPEKAMEVIEIHENAQLDCIKQTVDNGVRVIMAMDNLDTMFHSPDYVKQFSSSFYIRASEICHQADARFFIHACGQQRDNLCLISSLGVDGLEGVSAPPLGDVSYDEALRLTRDNFIITGGISAMETRDLKSKNQIYSYVEELFRRMRPYRSRFVFSSSCNTAIDTSWDTIRHFRDAWLKYRDI